MNSYKCQFCNYKIIPKKNDRMNRSAKNMMGLHYETKHKDLSSLHTINIKRSRKRKHDKDEKNSTSILQKDRIRELVQTEDGWKQPR